MKKIIKYILLTLLGLFVSLLLLMVAYPFWLMQPPPRPEQPKLLPEEVIFFNQLESELNVKVERFINNEEDVFPVVDTCIHYRYSIYFSTDSTKDSLSRSISYNTGLAYYIKDSLLNNSKNVIEIDISWLHTHSSRFYFKRDTFTNQLILTNKRNNLTK